MSDWRVKWRSATGPKEHVVVAETLEAAEIAFTAMLFDNNTWGSIIRIDPAIST